MVLPELWLKAHLWGAAFSVEVRTDHKLRPQGQTPERERVGEEEEDSGEGKKGGQRKEKIDK